MRLSAAMIRNLSSWTPRPNPSRVTLEGRYVRLEPLSVAKHEQALFEASTPPEAHSLFFYMLTDPPQDRECFHVSLGRALHRVRSIRCLGMDGSC